MTQAQRIPYDFNRVEKFEPRQNGKNMGDQKETVQQFVYICPQAPGHEWRGKFARAIEARVYMSRGRKGMGRVYASVWIHQPDMSGTAGGHGIADGGGYDKFSAAIDAAFKSAGVTFAGRFDGYGEGAVKNAMTALAKHLGWADGEVMTF